MVVRFKTSCNFGVCHIANGSDGLSINVVYVISARKSSQNMEQPFLDNIDILHFTSYFEVVFNCIKKPLDLLEPTFITRSNIMVKNHLWLAYNDHSNSDKFIIIRIFYGNASDSYVCLHKDIDSCNWRNFNNIYIYRCHCFKGKSSRIFGTGIKFARNITINFIGN